MFPSRVRLRRSLATLVALLLCIAAGGFSRADAQSPPDTLTGIFGVVPDPVSYGDSFTLTVVFEANQTGDPTPTGTVTFSVNGTQVGTAPVSGATAQFTVSGSTLDPGTYPVTAVFSGDTNYGPLTMNGSHTVTQAATSIVIQDVTTTLAYGQVLDGEALVYGPTEGGTIDFYIDNVDVCTLPLTASTPGGQPETCPASTGADEPVGTHTFYATYSGDTDFAGSTSPTYTFVVQPATTTATLTSSVNPSNFGQSVTFTANIASPYATPGGIVAFFDGTTQIGTAALDSSGNAAFTTTTLALGTHNITAQYAGTGNFDASTSNTVQQQVVTPPSNGPDLQLTVTPATVLVDVGLIGAATVQVVERNGLTEPVALACTGLPAEASCTFGTQTLPDGGGSTQLTLYAGAPHDCGTPPTTYLGPPPAGLGMLSLFTLLAVPFARRRRRLRNVLSLALLAMVLPLLSACGGHCTDFGVKPGVYSFTITATTTGSAGDKVSQTMKMNVQF